MTPKLDRYDAVSFVSLGAAVIVTAVLYSSLPSQVPIHFNLQGHANGWAPRDWGSFILPVTAALLWCLLRLGGVLLPDEWRARMAASPLSIAALLGVLLLVFLQGVVLVAAQHPLEGHRVLLLMVIGAYFVALGQLMPRIRRNPWIGIRTAFTLSSDENWLRTHRFAGYTMTLGGLAAIGLGAFSAAAALAAILTGALGPVVYSYVVARRSTPLQT